MKKTLCRFCLLGEISLLYETTSTPVSLRPNVFACTNSGFGVHGPIVKCPHCHIIYVAQDLGQEKINALYKESEDPTYFLEQKARQKTFEHYLHKLEKFYPQKGTLLDIGTNTGLFVKVAQDHGWQATGLEPNLEAAKIAKKNYNLDLINKPFAASVFKNTRFDVITMWDVIEHFENPDQEVAKVFKLLKPGGLFVFSTVDPESFLAKVMGTKWHWYMEMHRVFFSPQSARHYLMAAGFKKIKITPHWRYLSLGYFSTRLAALNPGLSALSGKLIHKLNLSAILIPYYANDLFDCYAFK